MKAETKKAVLRQTGTAAKNKFHNKTYLKSKPLSSETGEILLYLQRPLKQDRRKQLWQLFELNLRQFYGVKPSYRILLNASGKESGDAESTHSGRGYIR